MASAPTPLILVADDDPDVRDLVVDVLRQAGYRTEAGADGEEALALARELRPALVVLDVMMPRMDGYTALARLRGDPATREIPVIILTGQGEPVYRSLSVGAGAVMHLTKPFVPEAFLQTVRRVLAERESSLAEDRLLGDRLVERGFVSADQLAEARRVELEEGTWFGQVLLEMIAVSLDQLNRVRAELLGVPVLEFREAMVDLALVRTFPEELLRRHQVLPVRQQGEELTVVVADPRNRQAVAELEALTGARVVPAIAFRETIARLLDRAFPPARRPAEGLLGAAAAEVDASGVAQAYGLLLAALQEGARELRLEPTGTDGRVRFRRGERWVERNPLPAAALEPVVRRFRILAGLHDEAAPTRAYVRTRLEGAEVELELSFAATLHGEAVTVSFWPGGLADPDEILGAAVQRKASDLYLIEGTPPTLKVDGVATPLPGAPPLSAADLRKLLQALVPEAQRREFEATGEADLSYQHPELGRFRVNCYRALGTTGMVLRRVKTEIPSLEALGLPPILGTLALERQGLLLVVGATGSGKSTTVAAMLDHRNANAPGHIVTIEDPVEFIHRPQRSVISQREVGIDTGSYLAALTRALRQAPDVIFVGELRDRDTVATVLHAAETGHLVISTLHATNATGAIERLLHFFPADAREATLLQLSLLLRAVIAQRLVPRAGGKGRVAALEILLATLRVQALIRRGELESLRAAMEEGTREGLQTFDQALLTLYAQQTITRDDALRYADSPNNVRLRMNGFR